MTNKPTSHSFCPIHLIVLIHQVHMCYLDKHVKKFSVIIATTSIKYHTSHLQTVITIIIIVVIIIIFIFIL